MKAPHAPRVELRRTADFLRELRERTAAWIPDWDQTDGQGDFGQALLEVAARFGSEVAEGLEQTPEKMRRGLLDWLGVRGKAARPARMPVVFKLSDSAKEPVPALAPVRLQADSGGAPVVFETEKSLTILPARLQQIVAADPQKDAYYLPPPDLSSLVPVDPLPTEWTVQNFAPASASTLQLNPGLGLAERMVIEVNGNQYTITAADTDLVTLDRGLLGPVEEGTPVSKVADFRPFDNEAANQQEHILYLGDADLLNIEAAASIAVHGASALQTVHWEYWGRRGSSTDDDWQSLAIAPPNEQTVPGALILKKGEGPIDQKEISGHNSRWIRAYTKTILPTQAPFTATKLAIQINPTANCDAPPCPPVDGTSTVQADGMANTTPLVLDNLFFPLGKEPRQFDAFYVGSSEGFSKPDANVQLCFEMADRTFMSLSAVRGVLFGPTQVLVGVARDRALHLLELNPATDVLQPFRQRDRLYPPSPAFLSGPKPGPAVMLDRDSRWRPPIWTETIFTAPGFYTAACAGNAIWIWHEYPFPAGSGWVDFGQLPADPASVDSLLFLTDGGQKLVVLRNHKLYIRDWPSGANWAAVTPHVALQPVALSTVVAVRSFTSGGSGSLIENGTAGMVGIDENGAMFQVGLDGLCKPILNADKFDKEILPAAVRLDGKLRVAGVLNSAGQFDLVANDEVLGRVTGPADPFPGKRGALEPMFSRGAFHVLMTATDGSTGTLLDWAPFDSNEVFPSPITVGTAGGAPTEVNGYVVVPGNRADILWSKYDPSNRFEALVAIQPGIVVSNSFPPLAVDDLILRVDSGGLPVAKKIKSLPHPKDSEVFYALEAGFPADATRLDSFAAADARAGSLVGGLWKLKPGDNITAVNGWIKIGPDFFHVDQIDLLGQATLSSPSGAVPPANGNYLPGRATNGRIAPYFMPAQAVSWDAAILANAHVHFPQNVPDTQTAKAFAVDLLNHPTLLVFGLEFQDQPPAHPFSYFAPPFPMLIDAALDLWHRDTGDTSSSPELSWEYWSGKGWSSLQVKDDTLALKMTGAVQFTVPRDITPSDWAGKTNPWIRARLIGGDYGRERVTFDPGAGTVTRSADDIHPPTVLRLTISYSLCTAVLPGFVLTRDSGSVRDQSSANRSSVATVEAFVPLAVTLGRLVDAPAPTKEVANACSPPCNCPGQSSANLASGTPVPTATPAAQSTPISSERCLLVGLSGQIADSVNLLLLVSAERNHLQLAPLKVEAMAANRFEPVVSSDGTRAIGESGLVLMSFGAPPSSADLFGQPLTWLRLTPTGTDTTSWNPAIAGAYINAVYAVSQETLTRELVGSSDGEPNLTLTLARPPLLHNSLELRVRESVGDEERTDLANQGLVVSDDPDLPGDWVLWRQVDDPSDQAPIARVYALDESTGEIRFGDGLQGMIPPIGRDSIVAFRYLRIEQPPKGVETFPGNTILARTALNLVSPVESVESVTSASGSAGGAAQESDALVLQFGYARLRHRERAVTLRDFEDLTLESSPAILQARAFSRPGGLVQLVVVTRGKLLPTAAQVRELRRYLLTVAPPALAVPGALTIAPPVLRSLRIALNLEIETLDVAADVSVAVKERLSALFDPANWGLGQNPTEDDIATAIGSAPGLESIGDITRREVSTDGTELDWPDALKPTELAVLADNPVRLQFRSLEVTA